MADILTIIATAEWILLGLLACRWLKGWNKRFQDLYDDVLYNNTEDKDG